VLSKLHRINNGRRSSSFLQGRETPTGLPFHHGGVDDFDSWKELARLVRYIPLRQLVIDCGCSGVAAGQSHCEVSLWRATL
jgi:hypothetical protein